MPYTVSRTGYNSNGSQSNTVTVQIDAGSTVGVTGLGLIGGGTGVAGTCADNNSVAYTPGNFHFDGGNNAQYDTFYKINAPAATSLTYTMPTGSSWPTNICAVWVLAPTGGTSTYSDSKANFVQSATLGTDTVSTGAMSVLSSDSIILGTAFDQNNSAIASGTGFTQDGANFGTTPFQVIWEHLVTAANAAATWSMTGADAVFYGGLAFSIVAVTGAQAPIYYRKNVLYFI
jgi:hypothetical protein